MDAKLIGEWIGRGKGRSERMMADEYTLFIHTDWFSLDVWVDGELQNQWMDGWRFTHKRLINQ